jgi:hypothetical protein
MISRRWMIGGGAGAAVLGALGYRAQTRSVFVGASGPAYEPWAEWQGHSGQEAIRPLYAGVLAASAHNTQPWIFETGENTITVYADLTRHLGAADPFRRELFFSLGCALDNIYIAAFAQGFAAAIDRIDGLLTASPPRGTLKVAEIKLGALHQAFGSVAGEPFDTLRRLYPAIPRRHTHRGAYLPGKPLPPNFPLARIGHEPPLPQIAGITDAPARRALAALIVESTERFIADKEMAQDSARWFRSGADAITRHRDGVNIESAGLSPLMTALAKMLPEPSPQTADKYWLEATRDVQVTTAPAFGVYFVANRLSIAQAIDAGMVWQRQHLTATDMGLAAQPMNQPIEMMDRDLLLGRANNTAKTLRKIVKLDSDADPAFIFRVGYAEHPAPPSPRRKVDAVLRRSGFA